MLSIASMCLSIICFHSSSASIFWMASLASFGPNAHPAFLISSMLTLVRGFFISIEVV